MLNICGDAKVKFTAMATDIKHSRRLNLKLAAIIEAVPASQRAAH